MANTSISYKEGSFFTDNTENLKFGIYNWPWELACSYIEILADICINGTSSIIKKNALVGFNKDANEALRSKNKSGLKGYGLLDMAQHIPTVFKNQPGNNNSI